MAIQKGRFMAVQPPPSFHLPVEQGQNVLNFVLVPFGQGHLLPESSVPERTCKSVQLAIPTASSVRIDSSPRVNSPLVCLWRKACYPNLEAPVGQATSRCTLDVHEIQSSAAAARAPRVGKQGGTPS